MATGGPEATLLHLHVLGPLQVGTPSGPCPMAKGRQTQLVEWLVAHRHGTTTLRATVAALWGPGQGTGAAALALLAAARRSVELAGGALPVVSGPEGRLRLDPARCSVDADRFTTAVGDGHRLAAAGALVRADRRLRAAMAEWRGTPYGGLDPLPIRIPEADQLLQARLTGTTLLHALRLAHGGDSTLVADLRALVDDDPWQEPAWHLLIAALAAEDRRAEALRCLQDCRTALDELGLRPSSATLGIEHDILDHHPIDPTSLLASVISPPAGPGARAGTGPATGIPDPLLAELDELDGARMVLLTHLDVDDEARHVERLQSVVSAAGGRLLRVEPDPAEERRAEDETGEPGPQGLAAWAHGVAAAELALDAAELAAELRRWPTGPSDRPEVAAPRHAALRHLQLHLTGAAERTLVCVLVRRIDETDTLAGTVAGLLHGAIDHGRLLIVVTAQERSEAAARLRLIADRIVEGDTVDRHTVDRHTVDRHTVATA
jgi:DNA-binding SARP family transcriptional activator